MATKKSAKRRSVEATFADAEAFAKRIEEMLAGYQARVQRMLDHGSYELRTTVVRRHTVRAHVRPSYRRTYLAPRKVAA